MNVRYIDDLTDVCHSSLSIYTENSIQKKESERIINIKNNRKQM